MPSKIKNFPGNTDKMCMENFLYKMGEAPLSESFRKHLIFYAINSAILMAINSAKTGITAPATS